MLFGPDNVEEGGGVGVGGGGGGGGYIIKCIFFFRFPKISSLCIQYNEIILLIL